MSRATLLCTLALAFHLLACRSPAKLMDRGKAQQAFELSARRLESSEKYTPELIEVLGLAYAELQREDLNSLDFIDGTQADRFQERTIDLLEDLHARRTRVEALRLRAKRVIHVPAWNAEPNYGEMLREAHLTAAASYLAAAEAELPIARLGDRFAARNAVSFLERRKSHVSPDADVRALEAELRERGTVYVWTNVTDRTGLERGRSLEAALLGKLRTDWVSAVPGRSAGDLPVDAYADLRLTFLQVTLPSEAVTTEDFERDISTEVQVGVDTSGTPVFETRVEKVRARVTTVTTTYAADVAGDLRLRTATGEEIYLRELRGATCLAQTARRLDGDLRALNGQTVETQLQSRPTEEGLLHAAVDALIRDLPRLEVDRWLGDRRLVAN